MSRSAVTVVSVTPNSLVSRSPSRKAAIDVAAVEV